MEFKTTIGINFRIDEYVPIHLLSSSLRKIVTFIQDDNPYAGLLFYNDWWEHDGLHFFQNKATIHELFEIVKSPRALFEAMPGDDNVKLGITTEEFKWYLRIYTDWDENDSILEGVFDFTLHHSLASLFRNGVVPKLSLTIKEEPSEDFYKRIRL